MSIKTPRLIRVRCGVFYFRFIVPFTQRNTVKKTEIRRSLRTKDAVIARQAALLLSTRMGVFVANSKNMPGKDPLSEQQLLGWMQMNEAYKMKVRIFGNGEAEIETDTLEEVKDARAIVAEYAKMRSRSVQQAIEALPASRRGTTLEKAKDDYLVEQSIRLITLLSLPYVSP